MENTSAPTPRPTMKNVPASRPALQFLRMFNNTTTSTRDAASDTPPTSPHTSVDLMLPRSQPIHIKVSTDSSSDSVTPSSDSAPLPGSSTLTFLAAALSNASLGGVPPGILPSTQAATSTLAGEVPVQSGKKKRGPTNPNNLFKSSSGSTTARNLWYRMARQTLPNSQLTVPAHNSPAFVSLSSASSHLEIVTGGDHHSSRYLTLRQL
ncbi:hypothetical protein F4604DRAFT_1934653 [Suillus subluteus]|nr:hypothetical protein F4604DRAFT_1934653 [Suillus subluteus]